MWKQAISGEAVNLSRFSVIKLSTFNENGDLEVGIFTDNFVDPENWTTSVDVQVGEDNDAEYYTLACFESRMDAKNYIADLVKELNGNI